MKVVVTGSSGFLGKRVVAALRAQSVKVCPVSRSHGAGIFPLKKYDQTPLADVLIHLAEDANRVRVNAAGLAYKKEALETLTILLNKGFKTVIYGSSALLYGDKFVGHHEVHGPVEIVDNYTDTKRQSELAVLQHPRGVVVRLSNLYGPGMSESSVLSKILRQLDNSTPMKVFDDSPIRDMLWVDDAAAAIAHIAIHASAPGLFNLGSGVGTSIGALGHLAMRLNGQEYRELEATNPSGESSVLVLDIEQTKRIWNWQPKVALEAGLRNLIENKYVI